MTLEQLVTSRELSEKLKKAGVEQDALHCWLEQRDNVWAAVPFMGGQQAGTPPRKLCSAWTTDELLEKLPTTMPIQSDKKNPDGTLRWPDGFPVELELWKNENDYTCCYSGEHPVTADRPVEALGLLLLKLSEGSGT